MNNKSFEEQLRLLSQNDVPEAGALLEKIEELASERGYSSVDLLLRQFDVREERRKCRKNAAAAIPMTRLQILKYYRMNEMWPHVQRVRRTNPLHPISRENMRKVREVRKYVGDYIY